MDKQAIKGKRKARRMALQALYQWEMSGQPIYEIEAQFRSVNNMDKVDTTYFCRLLHGVPEKLDAIQSAFTPLLDRALESLNPIELTVLRLSTFELMDCLETPYRVVLDEAVMMAKEFGSQDGHRYVNGVLHILSNDLRSIEVKNFK